MQSPLKNLTFNNIILEIKFQYESIHSEGAIQSHLSRDYTNLQEDMENTMYNTEVCLFALKTAVPKAG